MRFLVKTTMDTQIANAAVKDGTLGATIGKILEDLKPEAVYFYEENGVRTQLLVVNIDDASELPGIGEPWWQNFGGTVSFHPAMLPEDLEKAMKAMAG